jgi:hypothetical protein
LLFKIKSSWFLNNRATKSIGTKLVDDTPPAPIRVQDVKSARTLASDITQSGAKLYDMLANEKEDRAERSRALRFLDMSTSATDGPKEQAYIERCIRDIIDNTKQALEDMRSCCIIAWTLDSWA